MKSKRIESEMLELLVAEYIAKGRKITVLDPGVAWGVVEFDNLANKLLGEGGYHKTNQAHKGRPADWRIS